MQQAIQNPSPRRPRLLMLARLIAGEIVALGGLALALGSGLLLLVIASAST